MVGQAKSRSTYHSNKTSEKSAKDLGLSVQQTPNSERPETLPESGVMRSKINIHLYLFKLPVEHLEPADQIMLNLKILSLVVF